MDKSRATTFSDRVLFLCLLGLALTIGTNVTEAVHELGHFTVATTFGAHITTFQPWLFLGQPKTVNTPLPHGQYAVVLLSGVLASTALFVLLLLVIPWQKLKAHVAAIAALFLVPYFLNSYAFLTGPFRTSANDATLFSLQTGCDEFAVSLVAFLAFAGLFWLWIRRTGFLRRCREAWSHASPQL